jgi:hypothetical protein
VRSFFFEFVTRGRDLIVNRVGGSGGVLSFCTKREGPEDLRCNFPYLSARHGPWLYKVHCPTPNPLRFLGRNWCDLRREIVARGGSGGCRGSDGYISYEKGEPRGASAQESSIQSTEIRKWWIFNYTDLYSGGCDTLRKNKNNKFRDLHSIINILTLEKEFSLSMGSYAIYPVVE